MFPRKYKGKVLTPSIYYCHRRKYFYRFHNSLFISGTCTQNLYKRPGFFRKKGKKSIMPSIVNYFQNKEEKSAKIYGIKTK